MPVEPKRKQSSVPTTRMGRMLRFGLLSGELALSTAIGTARQWSAGKPLDLASAVLTPGNADLLARRLASLRGPAMKVGQLLSLSGDEVVPEEFETALEIFSRTLRYLLVPRDLSDRLVGELNDPRFAVRETATRRLCRLDASFLPRLVERYSAPVGEDARHRLRYVTETIFYQQELIGRLRHALEAGDATDGQ